MGHMKTMIILTLVISFASLSFAAKETQDSVIPEFRLNHTNRSHYIKATIEAMWATPKQELNNIFEYLSVVDRTQCQSSFERLKISCLIETAKINCKSRRKKNKKNCDLYSDIAVINKLGEKSFISSRKKYHIMKNYKNYHAQAQTVLTNEYAKVAVEFSFSKFSNCQDKNSNKLECLSKGLDQFCLVYGDKNNLSWQYCAGAVIWTIGKNPG